MKKIIKLESGGICRCTNVGGEKETVELELEWIRVERID